MMSIVTDVLKDISSLSLSLSLSLGGYTGNVMQFRFCACSDNRSRIITIFFEILRVRLLME